VSVNETIEAIANRFVDITKAYKSCVLSVPSLGFNLLSCYRLTDENIRKNWELYGHPDGRQEVSMGIALPQWIIEGKNNKWVLGVYALIFGGALPILVVSLRLHLGPAFSDMILAPGIVVVREQTEN
jgi:translocation protein SEC63